MSSSREFAIRYLKAVEKKHEGYFIANKLKILDCVELKGLTLISVHITLKDLPFDIANDIESMFWK